MTPAAKPRTRLLIIVTADPERSGRLAEAIRLATGVSAWEKVSVTLFIGGAAVAGLLPGEGRFVDEDNIVEFLPGLVEQQKEVYVEAGSEVAAARRAELPFPELDPAGLASLAARHDYVMRF